MPVPMIPIAFMLKVYYRRYGGGLPGYRLKYRYMSKGITLADRMASMSESATLALNARAKQLVAEGKTIYNLTTGELASDTPDFIQEAVAKTLKLNKYTPVAGLPELRQQIAGHAREFYGLDWIQPENVVVTAGAKPALYSTLLALINPGDEVIVPTPAWMTSYQPLIELAGGVVVEVPLNDELDLDVAAIQAKLSGKTKAIIVNSPNNPTGAIFSKTAIDKLSAVLKDSGVYVIADDIYTKLVFEADFTLVPTAGFDDLVIINGFSKSQALTGWRIGYLIADKAIATAATSLLSHITGNAPLPSQYAAIAAMTRHDQPPVETIEALKRQRQLVVDGLTEAGIQHNLPGGSFYIFLDLRDITDSGAEWCERLLVEAGVALVPGEAFGAPGFARLTYVANEDYLKKALAQIKQFMSKDQN
jgi:aspartate aminotransferase